MMFNGNHRPPLLAPNGAEQPRRNTYRVSVRCSGGAVVDVDVVAVSKAEAPGLAFKALQKRGMRPQETTGTTFVEREERA